MTRGEEVGGALAEVYGEVGDAVEEKRILVRCIYHLEDRVVGSGGEGNSWGQKKKNKKGSFLVVFHCYLAA